MTTAQRLRAEIDRGRTGDKVPFPDPAAAPLGTDDEAAGTPPPIEATAAVSRFELHGDPNRAPAVTHESARGFDGRLKEDATMLPSWPHGRRRNRLALFMLAGAVVVMSAALTIWAALVS